MVTLKQTKLLLVILFLVMISTPLSAQTDESVKVFPLPIFELEQVVTKWLGHSGFDISKTSLSMGQVELLGVEGDGRCKVLLRPSSPLATEVHAKCTSEGKPDVPRTNKLFDDIAGHISGNTNGPSHEADNADVAEEIIPAVVLSKIESIVCLRAKLQDNDIQFSGFIVDEDGLIISTAHDVKGLKAITVVLFDGRELKGNLVKIDPHRDLAFIDIDASLSTYISVANGRNLLGMGERLYSVGCPINLVGTVYSGIVNGPPRRVNGLPLWQVNMEIHPGSSGSPVFDVEGNLAAIVKGRYRGTDSVGFLIPIETIVEFAKGKSSGFGK
jgi:serine protease Do